MMLAARSGLGQLAITEVQTGESASNTLGSKGGPDWWELSNFGTNTIALDGYCWNDASHSVQTADLPFTGISIAPGEAIIITETNATVNTVGAFRAWWGSNHVGAGVQILLSTNKNGLSKTADSVRLWVPGANTNPSGDTFDPADLADRVDLGAEPSSGIPSFQYDPANGTFDSNSVAGVNGAFTAATSTDVGSPGVNPGSGPVVLTKYPTNTTITVGVPVVFNISGYGLPKPKFTWFSNNVPVDPAIFSIVSVITNNASFSTVSVTNAQANYSGNYSVVSFNGVQSLTNRFTFTVNPLPSAPVITSFSPTNIAGYPGQTVTFTVAAYGNPTPTYEWYYNGADLGQSGSQLQVSLTDPNQTGTYSVVASNSVGTNQVFASLLVTPKPNLHITEVMSSENTNNLNGSTSADGDWWELSNLGTFPVNLQGYRFDDSHDLFSDAVTITNNVTIAPGESIILVNAMTPAQFKTWWGSNSLPANLQIITYPRIGFAAAGDSVYFWNAAATTESDTIDAVSFLAATRGVSFTADTNGLNFDGSTLSVAGVNGAFAAAIGGDIGSPGYLTGVTFTPPNLTNTTITASPAITNVGQTVTITVTERDDSNAVLTGNGVAPVLASTLGTLSAVAAQGNGGWTASLTATNPGSATVTGTVSGSALSQSAGVYFAGPVPTFNVSPGFLPGTYSFVFLGAPAQSFSVWSSTNVALPLAQWLQVTDSATANPAMLETKYSGQPSSYSFTIVATNGSSFYRIRTP